MTSQSQLTNPGGGDLPSLLRCQQDAFLADMMPSAAVRRERLDRVIAMTEEHIDQIVHAIAKDFGSRSRHETLMADVFGVISAARHAKRHLGQWMRPRRLPTSFYFRPGYNRLLRQPVGVVGIVAPWNYPYQLALGPAIGALAAGNRVMIKPSEFSPRLAHLLQNMVAATFPEDLVTVVTGGPAVGEAFVELPFDHLLFTGSTAVGRMVAEAAARNLTPVTLELGGKSPAIIDASADLQQSAARLAFGKLLNAGQTCIAPDYVLVARHLQDDLVAALIASVRGMYPRLRNNPDYTSIVSDRHFGRLQALVEEARQMGGQIVEVDPAGEGADPVRRRFLPTIVLGATDKMRIMQEEIFGPVLPIITYEGGDEAIAYVNRGHRPLALYWFGRDHAARDRVLRETIAGGVTINDCLWHVGQEDAPFGGVGRSGMGAYHGEAGFRTFSKDKPVFYQSRISGLGLLRPPYGDVFEGIFGLLRRIT